MRAFTLLLALLLPACLDPEAPPVDEATPAQADAFLSSPGCPDITGDLPGDPIDCIVPHGGGRGQRQCTNHMVYSFVRLIDTQGIAHCIQVSSTIASTSCGQCLPI